MPEYSTAFRPLLLASLFSLISFPAFALDEPPPLANFESPALKQSIIPGLKNYHNYFIKLKDKSVLDIAPIQNNGFATIASEKGYTMPARLPYRIIGETVLENQQKSLAKIARKLKFSPGKLDSRISRKFNKLVSGFSGVFSDAEINKLASAGVAESIHQEQKVKIMLDDALNIINAPHVWRQDANGAECNTSGGDCLKGKGVNIAIIDTGVDVSHPDLGNSTLRERNYEIVSNQLVTAFPSFTTSVVQVDGDNVIYRSSFNTLKWFSFATHETKDIAVPQDTAALYDVKLRGDKAAYYLATGRIVDGLVDPDKFQLYLFDLTSRTSRLIAEKAGGFNFVDLDDTSVVFGAYEEFFGDDKAFYRYDVSSGTEVRIAPFTGISGVTPVYNNGELVHGELDPTTGCINKFHLINIYNSAERILAPPAQLAGGIADLRENKLLYASCDPQNPPDIILQYNLLDLGSSANRTFAAPRPASPTALGGAIGRGRIEGNKIYFQRGYNSGRVYLLNQDSGDMVRLNISNSMLDFDSSGDRICILFSNKTIGCHSYSPANNYEEQGGVFNSKVIGGYNFIEGDEEAWDDQGHGTHVAATAAGSGTLNGVAPEANIISMKVLSKDGSGYLTDVIAAIERSFDPNGDGDISDRAQIASLSLGAPGGPDDIVSKAVDKAVANGMTIVAAAGNSGPAGDYSCRSPKDYSGQQYSICSPGAARQAITVGATTKSDAIAGFSGRGPVPLISGNIEKPDVVAPGALICAAQWQNAFLPSASRCIDNQHVAISGTSMATPMVSGTLALLLQKRPELDALTLKEFILARSSVDLKLSRGEQGSGRIDAASAVAAAESIDNPYIYKNGVVDSANYKAVGSPGSLASIFGTKLSDGSFCQAETFPLPLDLCGTSVTVNNVQAPLLYVSPTQVNFQVPFEAVVKPSPLGQKASVIVATGGAASNIGEILIGDQAPGIYGQNGYPNGIAAATHLDNHLVSFDEPAQPGEVMTLYITGLGQSEPKSITGEAATGSPLLKVTYPEVFIGDKKAEVLFAGKAPGFAGTDQLNIKVPADVTESTVKICGNNHCSNKLGFPVYSNEAGSYLPYGIELTTTPAFPAVIKKGSTIQINWKIISRPLPEGWKKDRRGVPQVKIQLYFGGNPLDILKTSAAGDTLWEGSTTVSIPTNIGDNGQFYIRAEAIGENGINQKYYGVTDNFTAATSIPQKTAFLKTVSKKYAKKTLLTTCQSQSEVKYTYQPENYPSPGAILGLFGMAKSPLKIPVYTSNGKLLCSLRKDKATGLYSSLPCKGAGRSLNRFALKKTKADSMIYFGIPGEKNKKSCIGPFNPEEAAGY